jgi:hypothetical protein
MAISSVLGSSALLPAGLGFRNKIINGDFGINQRAFSSSANPSATYGFDRWIMYANNGTSTYTAQSFTVGNVIQNQEPSQYLRVVSSGQTTSAAATNISQRIENVRTCAGQPVTISFWAKCGTAGKKIAVEVTQDFGTGGSPSSSVTTFINQITLSTSWVRYTTNVIVPSIAGKTLGTGGNDNLSLAFWFSAGTDFNARTGSLGIQSDTFEIWGVQLEQNYQPTPFEQRPIGVELALCQRYYFRIGGDSGYQRLGWGVFSGSTSARCETTNPVTMRSVASSIESSTIALYDQSTILPVTAFTLSSAGSGKNLTQFDATIASGGTTYRPLDIVSNNSTSAYIGVSAEL